MKKVLTIMLSCLTALSLFACADHNSEVNTESYAENGIEQEEEQRISTQRTRYDTMIQDGVGADKCFWEDGKVVYDDTNSLDPETQVQKSAILTTQTEYDMWFCELDCLLELANDEYYWPLEYNCKETEIEIEPYSDKENHFILKMLQPCDMVTITFSITPKVAQDRMLNRKEKPANSPNTFSFSITVSAMD